MLVLIIMCHASSHSGLGLFFDKEIEKKAIWENIVNIRRIMMILFLCFITIQICVKILIGLQKQHLYRKNLLDVFNESDCEKGYPDHLEIYHAVYTDVIQLDVQERDNLLEHQHTRGLCLRRASLD